jgi:uncharacterized radical SAM superfamily Fe-S cluster-containing enzyme
VKGVAFQPVTHSGRHITFDPTNRVTNADVIHALADQLPDWFRVSDVVPRPLLLPHLPVDHLRPRRRHTVVPVTRLIDVDHYLDYISNRVLPDPAIRQALEKLWSAGAFAGSPGTDHHLDQLGCAACGLDSPAVLDSLAEKVFMLVIQDFQDPYTLNVKQLMKCCVEELTPDGRIIPFCSTPARRVRASAAAGSSVRFTPRKATLPPSFWCTDSKSGISATQGGHQDAQKFTTTGLPR